MTYTEKYNQPSRVSPVGMGTSLDNKIMVEADSLQRELSVCRNRFFVTIYTRSVRYTMVIFAASSTLCQSTIANYAGNSKTIKHSYESSRTQSSKCGQLVVHKRVRM